MTTTSAARACRIPLLTRSQGMSSAEKGRPRRWPKSSGEDMGRGSRVGDRQALGTARQAARCHYTVECRTSPNSPGFTRTFSHQPQQPLPRSTSCRDPCQLRRHPLLPVASLPAVFRPTAGLLHVGGVCGPIRRFGQDGDIVEFGLRRDQVDRTRRFTGSPSPGAVDPNGQPRSSRRQHRLRNGRGSFRSAVSQTRGGVVPGPPVTPVG